MRIRGVGIQGLVLLGWAVCGAGIPLFASSQPACDQLLVEVPRLLERKQVDHARRKLESALPRCATNPEMHNLLGIIYEAGDDSARAQAAFREALRLAPRLVGPHTNLAISLLKTGRTQEALEEFRKALAIDPSNVDANANLGVYYLRNGDPRAALEAFRRGRMEQSNDLGLLMALTEACFRVGQRAEGHNVAARLLRLGGSNSRVRFSLGLLMAQNGEYRSAAENFLAIPERERDFAVYFNLGQAYSRMGRFEDARHAYFLAIDTDQSNPEVYMVVGLDYVAGRQLNRALPWLMRAHHMAPEHLDILLPLIATLIQTKYYETAAQLIAQGLGKSQSNARLYALQGDLLYSTNKLEMALDSYQKAAALDPGEAAFHAALGKVLSAQNRPEQARAEFQRALALDSGNTEANAQMGHLLLAGGQHKEALPYLVKAVRGAPGHAQASFDLSRVYVAENKIAEARSLVESLVHSDPENRQYHYELARLFQKEGQTEAARREEHLFRELGQESKDVLKFVPPTTFPE